MHILIGHPSRLIFLMALAIFSVFPSVAQLKNQVRVSINFHEIDKDRLSVDFDDGVVLEPVDLSGVDSVLVINKPVYTPYPTIRLTYDRKSGLDYFINSDDATLNLFYDANRTDTPFYSDANPNFTAIYDSITNEMYRDLRRGQQAELNKLNDLFKKHGHEIGSNDSIKYELTTLIKTINAKSMDFMTSYADHFFSFYYFKSQVLGLTNMIVPDPEYYKSLLIYYEKTFPQKFRFTGEGKQITATLQKKISLVHLGENMPMPEVYFKDSHGDTIRYKNQKERFVLLDFWASWCGPCIQQIPDIKILREQFTEESLNIVSISIDTDSTRYENCKKEHKLDWVHSLDRGGTRSASLGISSIPAVLLLDPDGKIVYYKNGGKLDIEKIGAIVRKKQRKN